MQRKRATAEHVHWAEVFQTLNPKQTLTESQ